MSFYLVTLGSNIIAYLLNAGIEAALLVPLILIIQSLSRDLLSPAAKHALWLILLLRLSLPILPESPLSLMTPSPFVTQPPRPNSSLTLLPGQYHKPSIDTNSPNESAKNHSIESPPSKAAAQITAPSMDDSTTFRSETKSQQPSKGMMREPTTDQITSPEFEIGTQLQMLYSEIDWLLFSFSLWLIGVLGITTRIFKRHYAFQLQLRATASITAESITTKLQHLKSSINITQDVNLYTCSSIHSPALYGILRPVILLPDRFFEVYSDQDQSHILLHELAHLKRRDSLWNLWTTLIQVLHWPNPIVWYALHRIRGDRELATDDLVLRRTTLNNPADYGETILKALQALPKKKLAPGLIGIAEDHQHLTRRFDRIARFERNRRHSKAAMICLMTILSVTCLTQVPLSQTPKHVMEVQVTDTETGLPLPNVEVISVFDYVVGYKSNETSTGRTNAKGTAILEIPIPPGPVTRFSLNAISPDNHAAQYRQWKDEEDLWGNLPPRHEFHLKKGISIGGVVTDESGIPLENIAIQANAYGQSKTDKRYVDNLTRLYRPYAAGIRTDKDGKWTCIGVPPSAGKFYLTFKKPSGTEYPYATEMSMNGRRTDFHGSPILGSELRSHSSRVILPKGQDIEIKVVSRDAIPIAGAKVRELTGALYRKLGTMQISNQSGMARFSERSGHQFGYIISHPEFATAHVIINLIDGETSARAEMMPRKTLKGRIIDEEGKPILGAKIDLGTAANTKTYIDWETYSDRKGHFEWKNAPLDKLFYRIRADGYVTGVHQLQPSAAPLEIVLRESTKSTITHTTLVLDETNELPIPEFTYRKTINLDISFNKLLKGINGKIFDQTKPDEMVTNSIPIHHYEVYYITVSAPGYVSGRSRPISIHESVATNVIKLRPIPSKHSLEGVTVRAPNGTPVSNATVFLVNNDQDSPPSIAFLSKDHHQSSPWKSFSQTYTIADTKGTLSQSSFPIGFQGIAILDDRGSLILPVSEIDLSIRTLQLQKHGSVKGTLRIAGKTQARLRIGLRASPKIHRLITGTIYTFTDDKGHFSFENVPPGNYLIFKSHPDNEHQLEQEYYSQELDVRSGTTTKIDYHLKGKDLTGTFQSNTTDRNFSWFDGTYSLQRKTELPIPNSRPRPNTFIQASRLMLEQQRHRNVVEETVIRSSQIYPVSVSAFGDFSIPSVPPGQYLLKIDIVQSVNPQLNSPKVTISQHNVPITIPHRSANQAINLGTIPVTSIPID